MLTVIAETDGITLSASQLPLTSDTFGNKTKYSSVIIDYIDHKSRVDIMGKTNVKIKNIDDGSVHQIQGANTVIDQANNSSLILDDNSTTTITGKALNTSILLHDESKSTINEMLGGNLYVNNNAICTAGNIERAEIKLNDQSEFNPESVKMSKITLNNKNTDANKINMNSSELRFCDIFLTNNAKANAKDIKSSEITTAHNSRFTFDDAHRINLST